MLICTTLRVHVTNRCAPVLLFDVLVSVQRESFLSIMPEPFSPIYLMRAFEQIAGGFGGGMPTPAPSQSPPTCGGAAAATTSGAHSGVLNRPSLNAVKIATSFPLNFPPCTEIDFWIGLAVLHGFVNR